MPAMRYMICPAGAGELPGVVACLAAAFETHRPLYTADAFSDTVPSLDAMTRRHGTMTILCASDHSSQVVGTIAFGVSSPGVGHLRGMAVLPDFQGRGIADELLAAAEGELRAQACTRVTLDTTEPLLRAMSFYTRHGYTRTGKVSDFFGMPLIEYAKSL